MHWIKNGEHSFQELLESSKLVYSDIQDEDREFVDRLIEENIIIENNGVLSLSKPRYFILKDLYLNQAINFYWISRKWKEEINSMILNNELIGDNKLLSRNEIAYFNYYLNDTYPNGEALRNKYSHGSTNTLTDDEHEDNYNKLCYLMSLFTIKVNEEFNYRYDIRSDKNKY